MQWQHLWDLIESEGFFPGLGVGVFFAYLFVVAQSVMRSNYVEDCAKLKSPVKIGKAFYYIVPERLYVRMDVNAAELALKRDGEEQAN